MSATTALKLPNSELVARAWLALVPQFADVGTPIVTTLPQDVMTWTATGAVQVAGIVGGSPDAYVPRANPVVWLKCWACTATQATPTSRVTVSNKPPWGAANLLAEQIRAATYRIDTEAAARGLAMPAPGYYGASVHAAYLLSEPRRIPGDSAGYACYTLDLQLSWVAEVPQ